MNLLIKYLKLSRRHKISLWIILYLYIKAIILVYYIPLNKYKHRFTKKPDNYFLHMPLYSDELSLILKLGKRLPLRITCLIESIVIQDYFKKYNLNVQIYLGVNKTDKLIAHAWCIENDNQLLHRISI